MQHRLTLKEIPLTRIDVDPDSPHHTLGTEAEARELRDSIRRCGVLNPLIVSHAKAGRYLIIDGYRRLRIARELGIKALYCTVNPPMSSAERAVLRLQLYLSYKPWTKAERTKQLRRLRRIGALPSA